MTFLSQTHFISWIYIKDGIPPRNIFFKIHNLLTDLWLFDWRDSCINKVSQTNQEKRGNRIRTQGNRRQRIEGNDVHLPWFHFFPLRDDTHTPTYTYTPTNSHTLLYSFIFSSSKKVWQLWLNLCDQQIFNLS